MTVDRAVSSGALAINAAMQKILQKYDVTINFDIPESCLYIYLW